MGMMDRLEVEAAYEKLIERFRRWAARRPDLRAAFVVGSRGRANHRADEWADLDVVIITTNPQFYIRSSGWVRRFGEPLLTFLEATAFGGENERRVLYEGMLDVDFAVIPLQKLQAIVAAAADAETIAKVQDMVGRGIRVLIDKDGMVGQAQTLASSAGRSTPRRPKQEDFLSLANNFLYHSVFTAKHLRRGETWWAAMCLNCHMQSLLLKMIEWHALADHGWKHDVWFRGRFMEEWAHPQAVGELTGTFAHYDRQDITRALLASMDLFRRVATETAGRLGYAYPAKTDRRVASWVGKCMLRTR